MSWRTFIIVNALAIAGFSGAACVPEGGQGEENQSGEEELYDEEGAEEEDREEEDEDEQEGEKEEEREDDKDESDENDEKGEIAFTLLPKGSRVTNSHIAWQPVERAVKYEMKLLKREPGSEHSREVYTEVTEAPHAQVPLEFRGESDLYIQVVAMSAGGDVIAESPEPLYACYECGLPKEVFCEQSCGAPSYGYTLRLMANPNGSQGFVEIGRNYDHFITYSPDDFADLNLAATDPQRFNDSFWEYIPLHAGEIVFDKTCSVALSGKVYFVPTDGGQYQSAISQGMTTSTFANDAGSMCGTYSDLAGLSMLFTDNSDIDPDLVCQPACNLYTGGYDGTDYSWDRVDEWQFIEGVMVFTGYDNEDDEGYPVADPSDGIGWADDVPLADLLLTISQQDNILGDDSERPQLLSLALRPASEGLQEDNRIEIDRVQLVRNGADYIDEFTRELDEGLYILTLYYGGHMLRPMALEHRLK